MRRPIEYDHSYLFFYNKSIHWQPLFQNTLFLITLFIITMNQKKIDRYAHLIVHYCCSIQPLDCVLIRSTALATPLILACQREIILAGATCELDISIPEFSRQMVDLSSNEQLQVVPKISEAIVEEMTVIISISAPHDVYELSGCNQAKLSIRQQALAPIKEYQMQRGSRGDLRWVICNYPTESLASAAGMTLNEYVNFISEACFLSSENAIQEWEQLAQFQEHIVDRLNQGRLIQFKSDTIDISFDVSNRRWINSDGRRNMPSGEVFTSPIETSANGTVVFDCPTVLFGDVLSHVSLTAENGVIVDWNCSQGKHYLDKIFKINGTKCFGEIAIGTNTNIKRPTLNTLFDEKIGGTIHMAIGASYPETGGKNVSGIHHDFIAWFNTNASIILDDDLIYTNGTFLV